MAALAATVLLLVLAGCGGDDDKDKGSASSGGGSEPSVSFVTPTDGEMTGDLTANVQLENFDIDAANVGKENADNKGHLHFSLDGGKFDEPKYSGANGELAVKLGVDGKYSPSVAPKITYKGLPKGEHTLEVDLANNDHSETGTSATTKFTVD